MHGGNRLLYYCVLCKVQCQGVKCNVRVQSAMSGCEPEEEKKSGSDSYVSDERREVSMEAKKANTIHRRHMNNSI